MNKWKIHGALAAANLIYGANYSIAKAVMPEYIRPFGFIFARVVFGTMLFWLFNVLIRNGEKVERKDLPLLALCGLLGVAANQLLFFSGLNLTSPINASLITTIMPLILLPIAAVQLKERITARKVTGVILGLSGAALLISNKNTISLQNSQLAGDLMIFLNATAFSFYLVLVKPLMQKYKAQTVIKWVFFFGMIVVVPFGWEDFMAVSWGQLPANAWMAILYVVLFTTFFAYLLNTWALKYMSSSVVAIYAYMQPVFATMIAVWIGQDSFTLEKSMYSLLIFAGVYLVTRPAGAQKIALRKNDV
ncbi:DMT family transporter [Nafulsella turpanensis]|uniref:DMT family transporter n=1 Tax=Nafulsella turpanensis TaxID=1265690 RepID=UPI0005915E6A|nr:DMT family transporter [Nafulsella turpanensis]